MVSDLSVLKIKLFYFASIFSAFGHIVDVLLLRNSNQELIVNCLTVGLTLIVIGLVKFRKLNHNKANLFIVYSVLLNLIISLLLKDAYFSIDALFMQSSLVYGIIILYAGFVSGKTHVHIVGVSFIAAYLFIAFYNHGEFLQKNMPLILVLLSVYIFTVRLIVNILNNYDQKQKDFIESLTQSNKQLKEQGEELNRLNTTKDKLLSVIGHDLKTPASSIMGFSDLIAQKAEKSNSESLNQYSKLIYQSANRLSLLLSQLLDWARIQSGKRDVNFEPFNAYDVICEVVDLMHGTIFLKKIEVVNNTPNNIQIVADKQMFSTIVRNLFTNALKYTPICGQVKIQSQIANSNFKFTITDSGAGIKKEVLSKLFAKQFIESEPGTENEKGTGLGMSICKEYIDLHLGEIWAESIEGQGATFHFTIPV